MSRSRLAGKAIYFVTRAKILEEAASIGNQANCSRFCANLAIAIITAHTKSALAEEKMSGRERDSAERLRQIVCIAGRTHQMQCMTLGTQIKGWPKHSKYPLVGRSFSCFTIASISNGGP